MAVAAADGGFRARRGAVLRLFEGLTGELFEEKPGNLPVALSGSGEGGQIIPRELSGRADCRGQFGIDEYSQDRYPYRLETSLAQLQRRTVLPYETIIPCP